MSSVRSYSQSRLANSTCQGFQTPSQKLHHGVEKGMFHPRRARVTPARTCALTRIANLLCFGHEFE